MPTCPVCKSNLKSMNKRHTDSKKHITALEKAGIDPSKDPALKLIATKSTSKSTKRNDRNLSQVTKKISSLEKKVAYLMKNQDEIIRKLNDLSKKSFINNKENTKRKLTSNDIVGAIDKCVQFTNNESRWVKIDDVISILKLNREADRKSFNSLLIKLFSKNIIDLAEGGNPKYPIIYQKRVFGMLARQ